jgi:hypothetical protein
MQVANKVVAVFSIERHECASHHNKLDLVVSQRACRSCRSHLINAVPELLELVNTMTCLQVWVVARSDGSHGCRLGYEKQEPIPRNKHP